MEEEKYIHINIGKYDTIFDSWLQETGSYVDNHCMIRVMSKFDAFMGVKHDEDSTTDMVDDDYYRFKVIDGKRFILAIIKYDLYE